MLLLLFSMQSKGISQIYTIFSNTAKLLLIIHISILFNAIGFIFYNRMSFNLHLSPDSYNNDSDYTISNSNIQLVSLYSWLHTYK